MTIAGLVLMVVFLLLASWKFTCDQEGLGFVFLCFMVGGLILFMVGLEQDESPCSKLRKECSNANSFEGNATSCICERLKKDALSGKKQWNDDDCQYVRDSLEDKYTCDEIYIGLKTRLMSDDCSVNPEYCVQCDYVLPKTSNHYQICSPDFGCKKLKWDQGPIEEYEDAQGKPIWTHP